jgi:hypothetical protein
MTPCFRVFHTTKAGESKRGEWWTRRATFNATNDATNRIVSDAL